MCSFDLKVFQIFSYLEIKLRKSFSNMNKFVFAFGFLAILFVASASAEESEQVDDTSENSEDQKDSKFFYGQWIPLKIPIGNMSGRAYSTYLSKEQLDELPLSNEDKQVDEAVANEDEQEDDNETSEDEKDPKFFYGQWIPLKIPIGNMSGRAYSTYLSKEKLDELSLSNEDKQEDDSALNPTSN